MSLTCPKCGLVSPTGAMCCDCGFEFEGRVADARDNGSGVEAQDESRAMLKPPSAGAHTAVVLGSTLLGAVIGIAAATLSFSCTSSTSSIGDGTPPAVEVPLELGFGLLGAGWNFCVWVGGAFAGSAIGAIVGLIISLVRSQRR